MSVEQELADTMRLWVIDDGEQHWVAATSPDDAIAALVESWGERPLEWDDAAPTVREADFTKPLRIRDDWYPSPSEYPNGVYREIVIKPSLFSKLPRGLVSSTIY